MKRRVRIAIYSGIYVFCIVAFFGIANGLGWEIEPEPRTMGYFVALYIGGLVPMWSMGNSKKTEEKQVVDWDKEMERRRVMGEELRRKKRGKQEKEE